MRSLRAIIPLSVAVCSLVVTLTAGAENLAFNTAPPESATLFEVRTTGVTPPYGGNVALPTAFLCQTEVWIGRFTQVSDHQLVMEVVDHRNSIPQFWLPPLSWRKLPFDFMRPQVVIPYEKIQHISLAAVPE